ncbi:MAG: zf-HC2 domain-containing protein [Anaerolineae bacterium]
MHEKYEDLLLLYMTHSISAGQLSELQTHLATCAACRASLREWRAIASAVQQKSQVKSKEPEMTMIRPLTPPQRGLPIAAMLTTILMLLIGVG